MKAILFDLDGVLVDSYDCWWSMINEVLEQQGKRPLTEAEFDATWGQGPEEDQQMFFPDKPIADVLRYYVQNFSRHLHLLKIEPSALPALQKLRENGKKLGVASNSPTGIVEQLLRYAKLYQYFDVLVGVEQVARAKPEPDMIFELCKRLDVSIKDACYVGDSIYDENAAKAAQIYFVGFKRSGMKTIQDLGELAWIF